MNYELVASRAKVHAGVHYRWYLAGLTVEHSLREQGKRAAAHEAKREALAHRNRALDACWILTGKWQDE